MRLIVVLLALIFLPGLSTQPASACTPRGPDPWFSTSLSFDASGLPQGIEIIPTDPVGGAYALINRTSEPLYLVRENPTDWKTFPNSELPREYEPRYKLVSSQVLYWTNYDHRSGWMEADSGDIDNAAARLLFDERIRELDSPSRQVYADDRPQVVDIPDPQKFRILAVYKGSPFEIAGTITYSLNQDYDPHALAKGVRACAQFNAWQRSRSSSSPDR